MGATKLGASVAYLEPEEDQFTEAELLAVAAGVVYPVMDNTTFQVQLQYWDGEVEDLEVDNFSAGTGLFVKF